MSKSSGRKRANLFKFLYEGGFRGSLFPAKMEKSENIMVKL
jgi:hypothetical protein